MAVPQRRLDFSSLISCHGNVPWQMAKYSTVPSLACKVLSYGKRIVKIGPVYLEIFDELRRTTTWKCNAISIHLFSSKTTGPIFTKILHDIAALVALFNLAHTWRYPTPFLNARATKVGSFPFFHKTGCHGNVPWDIKKEVQMVHLHPKCFHSV